MNSDRSLPYLLCVLSFWLLFALDLVTKHFWSEVGIQNAAFSFMTQVSAVVGLMVVVFTHKTWFWGSLGFAGAGGNLFDRFVYGYVRDWIAWSWNREIILLSNLADLWLVVAVIGIGWSVFRSMRGCIRNSSTILRW